MLHLHCEKRTAMLTLKGFFSNCNWRDWSGDMRGITPATTDQQQLSYREAYRLAAAVTLLLHPALEHLAQENTFIHSLFSDYISAFNTRLDLGWLGLDYCVTRYLGVLSSGSTTVNIVILHLHVKLLIIDSFVKLIRYMQ